MGAHFFENSANSKQIDACSDFLIEEVPLLVFDTVHFIINMWENMASGNSHCALMNSTIEEAEVS